MILFSFHLWVHDLCLGFFPPPPVSIIFSLLGLNFGCASVSVNWFFVIFMIDHDFEGD